MTSRQGFIYGTMVVAAASLLSRLLGFVYRVIIVRLVGTEAIGLYEMSFPLYALALVITTAGLPVGIARTVAELTAKGRQAQANRLFQVLLVLLTLLGVVFGLAFYLAAPWLATRLSDPRAVWVLKTMSPAILIVSISSAFRGFFQGRLQMRVPSWAQVLEQAVRTTLGIYLGLKFLPLGLEFAAMGLALAMVAGETAGLACLLLYHPPLRRVGSGLLNLRASLAGSLAQVFRFSGPVTLSRLLATAALALEAILIPSRLQAGGLSLSAATSTYGEFAGVAMMLVSLPSIVTTALAINLVPALGDSLARSNAALTARRSSLALTTTLMVALPSSLVLLLFASDLTGLLFNTPQAGPTLAILALGATFLYLQQTTNGILQGLGRVNQALLHSLIGSGLSLSGIYFLTANPAWGIRGAALSLSMAWVVVALLNLHSISTQVKNPLRLHDIVSLMAATSVAALVFWQLRLRLALAANLPLLLLVLTLGSTAYLACLLATGTLNFRSLLSLWHRTL